jgi:hypothetical protein
MADMFVREDWSLFRSLGTLGQRAGVVQSDIAALVVKELVDNGLDAAGQCRYERLDDHNGFFVENEGNGLPADDDELASLFSIKRPLTSSKLLRLPTRGALGNGLRVVTGAVLCTNGKLAVSTAGRTLSLMPRDDGQTAIENVSPWDGTGTRIEVVLGDALPVKPATFRWAQQALEMALAGGTSYSGATSAWWYDSDAFHELLQASGDRTVRQIVELFDGCANTAKAGKTAAEFKGRLCTSLTRDESEALLSTMRRVSRAVKPKRLGSVGRPSDGDLGYGRQETTVELKPARGVIPAEIPMVVEVWAGPDDSPSIVAYVNRTPITAEVSVSRCFSDKSQYGIMGCGMSNEHEDYAIPVKVGRRDYSIELNITTPYMPITTDGKAPNLRLISDALVTAIEKAIRASQRINRGLAGEKISKTSIVRDNLDDAIAQVSGDGKSIYSQRQLFYGLRPFLLKKGLDLSNRTFGGIITDIEWELGHDLPGIYRDNRGMLYHPHTGEIIPLGTRSVKNYRRPEWNFNKILYCEKEGFFEMMIQAQWPERHDCALMTGKGFASRAVRDVIDILGFSKEPLTFYCVHDADGPGTVIYQALQFGTRARAARKVTVINIGLEPAEALEMGLPTEPVQSKKGKDGNPKRVPVADYVDDEWREWLQTNRVELNAMSSPAFLEWLDGKIPIKKLIPPPAVMGDLLRSSAAEIIRQRLIDQAILEFRVDERTKSELKRLGPAFKKTTAALKGAVVKSLKTDEALPWTQPVTDAAAKIATDQKAKSKTNVAAK